MCDELAEALAADAAREERMKEEMKEEIKEEESPLSPRTTRIGHRHSTKTSELTSALRRCFSKPIVDPLVDHDDECVFRPGGGVAASDGPYDADVPMREVNDNLIKVLSIVSRRDLHISVGRLLSFICAHGLRKFRVTSACSGTDMIVASLGRLSVALERLTGISVQYSHPWSCESIAWKREFIRKAWGQKTIFKDVGELCNPEAAFDDESGREGDEAMESVLSGELFVAGFSCKNMSKLNKDKQDYGNCICEKKGTSGVTFDGVIGHVRSFLPLMVCLENVATMGKANIAAVLEALDLAGYLPISLELDSKSYGVPMSRPRVYFLAMLRPAEGSASGAPVLSALQEKARNLVLEMQITPCR